MGNSFRTQQQIQSQQFNPQQNQQQFNPQQNRFIPPQNQQQFTPQQQQGNNFDSSIQDQIRTQQEFLNQNRHRLSVQAPQQQQQQQQQFFFGTNSLLLKDNSSSNQGSFKIQEVSKPIS